MEAADCLIWNDVKSVCFLLIKQYKKYHLEMSSSVQDVFHPVIWDTLSIISFISMKNNLKMIIAFSEL